MKCYSSGVGARLIVELRGLSDLAFQARILEILRIVFPDMQPSPPRSRRDKGGIDHFLLLGDGESEAGYRAVYQCKGFEVPVFGPSQLAQCKKSIRAFARSTYKTQDYFLVVNRVTKAPFRESLLALLAELERKGKASEARLFDLESFLVHVFDTAESQVNALLASSVVRFRTQHQTRMNEEVYLENVPFQTDEDTMDQNGALNHVRTRLLSLVRTPGNKRSWTFVLGEFGYGKTSLSLHLCQALASEELTCLYLPVAQIGPRAFDTEKQFMLAVLQILRQEELDHPTERDEVQQATLKELLKREKNVVLLFDGLDEHPLCWEEQGVRKVFAIFKTFVANCVFAMRAEFARERSGNLGLAVQGGPGTYWMTLTEWGPDLILAYCASVRRTAARLDPTQRLDHFEDAVRTGRYVDLYGDIPKRPLFLRMLVDDVLKEDLRVLNLADLYHAYFNRKFIADRATSARDPVVLRPLNLKEDHLLVRHRLFTLMVLVAGEMVRPTTLLEVLPEITEERVRSLARGIGDVTLDMPSVLLHSVLVPIGRRGSVGQETGLRLAFAHRSFQEFFLARFLFDRILGANLIPFANCGIPSGVVRFFLGLFRSAKPDDQLAIRAVLSEAGGVLHHAIKGLSVEPTSSDSPAPN